MTEPDYGTCAWCDQPADRLLTLKPGVARQTAKGALVTSLPRQLPACATHAHQLYRHNAERLRAMYEQAQQIANARQCRLF